MKEAGTARSLIALGISGGLMLCSSALVVLLEAINNASSAHSGRRAGRPAGGHHLRK